MTFLKSLLISIFFLPLLNCSQGSSSKEDKKKESIIQATTSKESKWTEQDQYNFRSAIAKLHSVTWSAPEMANIFCLNSGEARAVLKKLGLKDI